MWVYLTEIIEANERQLTNARLSTCYCDVVRVIARHYCTPATAGSWSSPSSLSSSELTSVFGMRCEKRSDCGYRSNILPFDYEF